MSADMDTADVLDAAADLIAVNGHAKQVWSTPGGCLCIGGALARAMNLACVGDVMDTKPWTAFEDHIGMWPSNWNDYHHRSASEVVVELRKCAARVRLGEIK